MQPHLSSLTSLSSHPSPIAILLFPRAVFLDGENGRSAYFRFPHAACIEKHNPAFFENLARLWPTSGVLDKVSSVRGAQEASCNVIAYTLSEEMNRRGDVGKDETTFAQYQESKRPRPWKCLDERMVKAWAHILVGPTANFSLRVSITYGVPRIPEEKGFIRRRPRTR